MTPICTAPTSNKRNQHWRGLVLVELLVAMAIIGMMLSVAMISFSALSGNNYFRRKVSALASVFQMAYDGSQQSDRRYAVILNFDEQSWMLRQFNQLDFEGIPDDEAVIKTGFFDERFYLDYVLFDDLLDTREPRPGQVTNAVIFYAGHGGWMNGGKVVLRDEDGNPWSIVLFRIGKPVSLVEGDAAILVPLEASKMPF